MSIRMDVTRSIIEEKIREEDKFSLEELKREIKLQGGGRNIAPGVTVKDYLNTLEDNGLIKYNSSDKFYTVIPEFKK